jgi:hypothetical protein
LQTKFMTARKSGHAGHVEGWDIQPGLKSWNPPQNLATGEEQRQISLKFRKFSIHITEIYGPENFWAAGVSVSRPLWFEIRPILMSRQSSARHSGRSLPLADFQCNISFRRSFVFDSDSGYGPFREWEIDLIACGHRTSRCGSCRSLSSWTQCATGLSTPVRSEGWLASMLRPSVRRFALGPCAANAFMIQPAGGDLSRFLDGQLVDVWVRQSKPYRYNVLCKR